MPETLLVLPLKEMNAQITELIALGKLHMTLSSGKKSGWSVLPDSIQLSQNSVNNLLRIPVILQH